MRKISPATFIQGAALTLSWVWMIAWATVPVNGDAPPAEEPSPIGNVQPSPASKGQGTALQLNPKRQTPKGWIRTKATFYGEPYDSHPSRYKTADETPYDTDGLFVAVWTGGSGQRLKLGTRIEIFWLNSGFTSFHVVRDRQASKRNPFIDTPTGKWRELSGLPKSAGLAEIEWRVVKQ